MHTFRAAETYAILGQIFSTSECVIAAAGYDGAYLRVRYVDGSEEAVHIAFAAQHVGLSPADLLCALDVEAE
jgi:hypothetical protein